MSATVSQSAVEQVILGIAEKHPRVFLEVHGKAFAVAVEQLIADSHVKQQYCVNCGRLISVNDRAPWALCSCGKVNRVE